MLGKVLIAGRTLQPLELRPVPLQISQQCPPTDHPYPQKRFENLEILGRSMPRRSKQEVLSSGGSRTSGPGHAHPEPVRSTTDVVGRTGPRRTPVRSGPERTPAQYGNSAIQVRCGRSSGGSWSLATAPAKLAARSAPQPRRNPVVCVSVLQRFPLLVQGCHGCTQHAECLHCIGLERGDSQPFQRLGFESVHPCGPHPRPGQCYQTLRTACSEP